MPIDGSTLMSIWAARTGLLGLLQKHKKEQNWGGEGSKELFWEELGERMKIECDQNALCEFIKFSMNKNIMLKIIILIWTSSQVNS